MSKRNTDVECLLDIIEQIEYAYEAQVDSKMKYAFVFFNLLPKMNVQCDEANIIFSWKDPDGTYVDAFIGSVREFRDGLDKLAL
jgi:hypothetical protein